MCRKKSKFSKIVLDPNCLISSSFHVLLFWLSNRFFTYVPFAHLYKSDLRINCFLPLEITIIKCRIYLPAYHLQLLRSIINLTYFTFQVLFIIPSRSASIFLFSASSKTLDARVYLIPQALNNPIKLLPRSQEVLSIECAHWIVYW